MPADEVWYSLTFTPVPRRRDWERLHYACPECTNSYIDEQDLDRHLDWHVDNGDLEPCSPPEALPTVG